MHSPPFAPEERRDPALAIPAILCRELDQPRDQTGTDGAASAEIIVALNWFEELTVRVPVP